jgi:hypothetical protein
MASIGTPTLKLTATTLTWTRVTGASGYVLVDTDAAGRAALVRVAAAVTTYPAQPGHTYNVFARGPFSDAVHVPAVPDPPAEPPATVTVDIRHKEDLSTVTDTDDVHGAYIGDIVKAVVTGSPGGALYFEWDNLGLVRSDHDDEYVITDAEDGEPLKVRVLDKAGGTLLAQDTINVRAGLRPSSTPVPGAPPVVTPPVVTPPSIPSTSKRPWWAPGSYWTRDIPDGLQAALVNDARAAQLHGSATFNCSNGYGIPVWVGKSTDPLIAPSASDLNRTESLHIPAGATAAHGTDGAFAAADPIKRLLLDAWQWNGGRAASAYIGVLGQDTGMQGGMRAADWHYAAGLIFGDDLADGRIDTALCLAVPGSLLRLGPIPPARSQDAGAGDYGGLNPMGTFGAIPEGVDITKIGLQTREGLVVADALQRKGAFIGDRAGNRVLFGDPVTVTKAQEANLVRDATALFKALWVGPLTGVTR